MNYAKMIEVCEKVSADVEQDARDFDGKPFTGKTVAEYFGYHGAAIKAIADMLAETLKELEHNTL